jgi:hypothetical protein
VCIGVQKAAVVEVGAMCLAAGVGQQAFRGVNTGGLEPGKAGGEAAGVEARSTADLKQADGTAGLEKREQRGGDGLGVVREETLPAERVDPPAAIKDRISGHFRDA